MKIEIDKPTSDPVLLEARRAFLASKPKEENQKAVHPLRSSDSEGPSDNDNPLEETFEERADRKRKDKEERKRKKKMEDQRAKRFKRMQAFQARSGMQNFLDDDEPNSENIEVDDNTSNAPEDRLLEDDSSLGSFNDRLVQPEKCSKGDVEIDNNTQETVEEKSAAEIGHKNVYNPDETRVKDDTSVNLNSTKVETRYKKNFFQTNLLGDYLSTSKRKRA